MQPASDRTPPDRRSLDRKTPSAWYRSPLPDFSLPMKAPPMPQPASSTSERRDSAPPAAAPSGHLRRLGLVLAAIVGAVFGGVLALLVVQLLEIAGAGPRLAQLGLLATGFLTGIAVSRSGGFDSIVARLVAAGIALGMVVFVAFIDYLSGYYPEPAELGRALGNTDWSLFERWLSRSMGTFDGVLFVAASWLAFHLAGRVPFRVRRARANAHPAE